MTDPDTTPTPVTAAEQPGAAPSLGPGMGVVYMLAAAQFVMVLDSTVMNVSITRIVADLHTNIVGIQSAITAYTLVMAAFMLIGGKLGVRWGAKRAFGIGLLIYGAGSLITALSPNLPTLLFGWSGLEGLGAVLVIPSIAALIAATYTGRRRALGYGIMGGVAGAAAAAGPLIGGWVTTALSWRIVFAAETGIVLLIISLMRFLPATRGRRSREFDTLGGALSASGMGLIVFGVLRSSEWGWVEPAKAAPFALLGFSPVVWLVLIGVALVAAFVRWEERVVAEGREPLLDLKLLRIPRLRAGLSTLVAQQFVIAGTFFVIPLYLQTMLSLNALSTGIKVLPLSAGLLVFALAGASLSRRYSPKRIVAVGIGAIVLAELALIAVIEPHLRSIGFALALGLLGSGLGLVASQLGNVNLSSVEPERGGEVGGLQGTAQNLGASLGTAFVGSLLLLALTTGFNARVANNPDIPDTVRTAVSERITGNVPFLSDTSVADAIAQGGLSGDAATVLLSSYEDAQVMALKKSLGLVALLALGALWFVSGLPDDVLAS
jgi:EmrB/QacA subfamily drug resistance transporter